MYSEGLPVDGAKIVVNNPDGISRSTYNVRENDVAKVVGRIHGSGYSILAYNPDWKNKERDHDAFTYKGPCVILCRSEYKVIE
ncbi:hypothetical protein Bestia_00156 [Acinetobacter phage Bestia]|nr:hypothetical protein Bestia_00156 [Acinetobacter phage Bestia]